MDRNQKFNVAKFTYYANKSDGYMGNNLFANNNINLSITYYKLNFDELKNLLKGCDKMSLYGKFLGCEEKRIGKSLKNDGLTLAKIIAYKNLFDTKIPDKLKNKFLGYRVRLEFENDSMPCDVYYDDVLYVYNKLQENMEKS